MHLGRLGQSIQSPEPKHCRLFLVVQTCKLKDVDAFIEQFHDIFYTALREKCRNISFLLLKNLISVNKTTTGESATDNNLSNVFYIHFITSFLFQPEN